MSTFVESVKYEADITDITAKIKRIDGDQSELEGSTKTTTDKLKGHWGVFSGGVKTAALGIAGVAGAAAVFGPQILAGGAEIEAIGIKAQTVFSGGSLATVQSWAAGVAASMGLTETKAVGLAAGVGDLLKPMGFTAEQAATMSTDLVNLSGALSAWSGGTVDAAGVSDILTKALLGETDGLKALGISISAAEVDARLAAKGQSDLTGAALAQAKALATQELIMEKSTDAQTAWTDGSMDAIKQQNESKASLAGLSEAFTTALYPALQAIVPIITEVATWVGEHLPGAFDVAREIATTVFDGVKSLVGTLADAFDTNGKTIVMVLGGVGVALAAVALAWNAGPGIIITAVVALGAALLYAYGRFDWFKAGVDAVLQAVGTIITTAWDIIEPILVGIGDVAVAAFEVAKAGYENVLKPMWDAAGVLIHATWTIISPVIDAIGAAVSAAFGVAKVAYDTVLAPMFGAIGSMISIYWEAAKLYVDAIGTGVSAAFSVAKVAYDTVLAPMFSGLSSMIQTAWDLAKPVIDTIGSAIGTVFGGISTVVETAIGWVQGFIDVVKGVWDTAYGIYLKIDELINGKVLGNIAVGAAVNVPAGSVPRFHSGGVVPGVGPTPILALGGEVIRTESQERALQMMISGGGRSLSGSSVSIGQLVVQAPVGADADEYGRVIVAALARFERLNGPVWQPAA